MIRFLTLLLLFTTLLKVSSRGQVIYSITFKDESLISALNQISKHYNLHFAYDSDLLKDKYISVQINCSNENSAITDLLKSTGLTFRKIKDLYLIEPLTMQIKEHTIYGYIKDSLTGEPLPSASIFINRFKPSVLSNNIGYYIIKHFPSDTVEISVFYLGYEPFQKTIILKETNKRIDINLSNKSMSINEVIVKGPDIGTMQILSKPGEYSINISKLKNIPIIGEPDVFYALKLIPGINATSETSAGIEIRGCPSEYNFVLFDGFPLYQLDHFFGTFSALNTDVVKNIKIYKGGYEAKYGGRATGIIDIIGKSGNVNKPSIGIGINMLSSNIIIETPIFKKVSVLFAARRSYTDILKSSIYKSISNNFRSSSAETTYSFGGHIENISNEATPIFFYYDLNLKLTWRPSQNQNFSMSLYKGSDNYEVNNEHNGSFYLLKTENLIKWGNKGAGVKWNKQWNNNYFSSVNIAISSFKNYYKENGLYIFSSTSVTDSIENKNVNEIQDVSFTWNNELNLMKTQKLEFGLYYSNKEIEYHRYSYNTEREKNERQGNEYALFIQNTFSPLKNLSANAGLRFNIYDLTNSFHVEPRLMLKYSLLPTLFLKGAFSKHHQYVSKVLFQDYSGSNHDFWVMADTSNIPVISSNHFITGFTWKFKSFEMDLELYHMNFSCITGYSILAPHLSYSPSVYYIGNGASKGIDIFLQRKGELSNTCVGYSLSHSYQKFDMLNNGKVFPSINDQTHEFKIIHNIKLKNWDIIGTWVYGSGKPYTMPTGIYTLDLLGGNSIVEIDESLKNNYRLPSYHRLDVAIGYFIKMNKVQAHIGISLINLYNNKNVRNINYTVTKATDNNGKEKYIIASTKFKSLGFTPNFYINFNF